MRSSMAHEISLNSRSMIPSGHYCFQCEISWTYEDLLNWI